MRPQRLAPDFVVGGTPKSGTTTLCALLKQHPQIFMSDEKEPHFFIQKDGNNPYGLYLSPTEYQSLFKDAHHQQITGERSTWYFHNAHLAASKIKQHNKSMKLIFLFRNPIDRCYSDYWYHIWRGNIDPRIRFDDLVKDRSHWIHDANRYTINAERFVSEFSPEQIRFVLVEDLIHRIKVTLTSLCEFLKIDSSYKFDFFVRENITKYPRYPALLPFWGAPTSYASWRDKLNAAARSKLLFSKKAKKPKMSPASRQLLIALYHDEIYSFGKVIGRDVSYWLE